ELLVDNGTLLCERLFHIEHDGKRFVFDGDQFGSVTGGIGVVGDYGGNRLADVTDAILGEDRVGRDLKIRHSNRAGDHAQAIEVGYGEHGNYARMGAGGLRVDGSDARVGVRGAHEGAVHEAGKADVVGIVADAANQARIFLALEALTYPLSV